MTLIGFLRGTTMNVYTGEQRVITEPPETEPAGTAAAGTAAAESEPAESTPAETAAASS
jgi:hypothetical protein